MKPDRLSRFTGTMIALAIIASFVGVLLFLGR